MSKKKVMIFVDWFEPGYKAGGPIQSCKNFATALNKDFDIFIFTSDRDLGDVNSYEGITTDTWTEYGQGIKIYYASPGKLGYSTIKQIVQSVKPHFIYLNSMYSLRFTIFPLRLKQSGKTDAAVVISPRGMLQEGALQFKRLKKKAFICLLNMLRVPELVTFHATDQQEERDIRTHFPRAKKIFVADNFLNMTDPGASTVKKESGHLKLIFLSRIVRKKNILFLINLLKENKFSGIISLDIAGDIEDKEYWQKCVQAINDLPPGISIRYIGAVPNSEVFALYSGYHVFILPTWGENFGHAIYEALLSGKPVLLSNTTPWKDLREKEIGYDISLNDKEAFIGAIQHFINMGQEEYSRWSSSATDYAKKIRSKQGLRERYLEIFH
jgi:glycosyltransferase involved in cell wall biosynthesis